MTETLCATFTLEKTCRLCLSQSGVLSPIFQEEVDEPGFISLPAKIEACVNVEVSKEDELPYQICHRCLYQVERSYDFKEHCQKSDKILRDYISSKIHMKEENANSPIVNENDTEEDAECDEEEEEDEVSDADKALVESLAKCPDLRVVEPPCDSTLKDLCLELEKPCEQQKLCPLCKDVFPNEELLWVHIAKHNAEGPPFACPTCFQTFEKQVDVEEHSKSHNQENILPNSVIHQNNFKDIDSPATYNCPDCDKTFSSSSDLNKHAIIHAGLRPFKCQICPKEFSRSTNLNKHMRVHSGQRPYSCGECPKMFRTRGDMLRHQIIHTGQKPFSCSFCLISFNRKDKLTRHERLHSTEKPFSCSFCSMTFSRRDDLSRHNVMHLNEESEQVTPTDLRVACKQESEPMADEDASADGEPRLTIVEEPEEATDKAADEAVADDNTAADEGAASETDHSQVDTSPPVESMVISVDPFQATSCDSSTCWPQNLTVKKAEENRKPYTCEVCNKKFSDKSYMKTHQLTHLGVRPHACGYCGKAFFRRRELLRHDAVHTGVKPFQCKICQKAFARSDKLMRHERTHGNAQQHACSHCPAKFVRKDDLSRHEMSHTGQKPHACSTCAKTFATKAEVTRHEKTHVLKEFKCSLCPLVFPRKDRLGAHMRSHEAHPQLQLLDNVVDLRSLMAQCTRFGVPPADLHLVPLKQT